MKTRNAPNLKKLPADLGEEAIIFAGADAWTFAKAWQDSNPMNDKVPPVVIGPKELPGLATIRIVDDGRRYVGVYRGGALSEMEITTIATKLALAGVKEARLYDEAYQLLEDWSSQLPRLRIEAESGHSVVINLPVNHRTTEIKPGDELKPRVESRDDGIFWVVPKLDKESGEVINNESWLCSPLEVLGAGFDSSKQRFIVLRWKMPGRNGHITRALPWENIGDREGWRSMKNGGVSVTTKNSQRAILADWMQQNGNLTEWHICHSAGWHHGVYIMPDGTVIGESENSVIFSGRSAAATGYTVKGSAESWRESVSRLAGGNPSMMLGIATALSAPLIGLAGADGFGVHLFAQSSAGKTTTANIASSVYGEPDALRLTWYGTALGIANEAEAHNDGLLPLDEVGQGSSAKDVATSAYTLFNGYGKLQGAKEGGNRDLKRWRTVAISTGEMDIETYLASGGMKVKAGQLVRLLNVPMEKAEKFHECATGKAHADALRDAYQDNHGAVGRAWIEYLAGNQQLAKDAIRAAQSRWRTLIPSDYGEQVHRVSERFAILEASLVLAQHITGWAEQDSRDAIQHCFNAWVKEFGTGNREHKQIIEQCEAFLNAFGLSRFAPLPYSPEDLPIRDLAGYRERGQKDDSPMIFYTFPAAFDKEIAQGFNPRQFARVLSESGMLNPPSSGRGYQRKSPRIDGRQLNVYVIQQQQQCDADD